MAQLGNTVVNGNLRVVNGIETDVLKVSDKIEIPQDSELDIPINPTNTASFANGSIWIETT